ncbi:MAG: hypothetical protein WC417_04010 [Candidatus Omnitrophota bacterium]|jgi:hypothetical protein
MRKFYYIYIIMISFACLSLNSAALASDAEVYESSTASTYYDQLLNYRQQQADQMEKFKDKIGGTVATLKEDIETPSSEVKSGKHKYTNEDTAVLGSLYGTRGKLERDKSAYKEGPGIAGVSDTQILGSGIVTEINPNVVPRNVVIPLTPTPIPNNPAPAPVPNPIPNPIPEPKPCVQTAYGCI